MTQETGSTSHAASKKLKVIGFRFSKLSSSRTAQLEQFGFGNNFHAKFLRFF
jgi:hypothetical protein